MVIEGDRGPDTAQPLPVGRQFPSQTRRGTPYPGADAPRLAGFWLADWFPENEARMDSFPGREWATIERPGTRSTARTWTKRPAVQARDRSVGVGAAALRANVDQDLAATGGSPVRAEGQSAVGEPCRG
jgi:hypothetical protein